MQNLNKDALLEFLDSELDRIKKELLACRDNDDDEINFHEGQENMVKRIKNKINFGELSCN